MVTCLKMCKCCESRYYKDFQNEKENWKYSVWSCIFRMTKNNFSYEEKKSWMFEIKMWKFYELRG